MHQLGILWAPSPPYDDLTEQEAEHELHRIANRLKLEEQIDADTRKAGKGGAGQSEGAGKGNNDQAGTQQAEGAGAGGAADQAGAGHPKGAAKKQLKSWIQPELDEAIREYKARRASTYHDLVEGVKQGKPGAVKSARKMFGRNAIARELAVKARAMVTNSPEWQGIARDLKLSSKFTGQQRRKGRRIGNDIAHEQKAESLGDTTQTEAIRNETINLARKNLPSKEAEGLIDGLATGQIDDDQARKIIKLAADQKKDNKSGKIRSSL